ncbi:T9SS type A sorting domain-containing protein [Hymenobacter rubripertinctus]|uniref:Uncharacterized protein n=1 Tax=Hymenobacter rubripertinctus TaxID=2029981 RepID=A0A418QLT6_9BACT|nr:hypothetical protein [Hymenobacter rubripertinctus]RIY06098.1 hypothetical protein D0T11_19365 [Hymenobacter rubripertinctus]
MYAAANISAATSSFALTVGTLTQAVAASEAFYVTRLNASGQAQMIALGLKPGAGSDSFIQLTGIAWDAATGTLVVTGYYNGQSAALGTTALANAPTGGLFVAHLTPAGQWQNVVSVATTGTSSTEFGIVSAGVGPQGQVAAVLYLDQGAVTLGSTTLTAASGTPPKIVVAQLSPAGQWQWVAQSASSTLGYYNVRYAPDGSLWTLGTGDAGSQLGTTTLPANTEAFVARLSAAGQWGTVGVIGRKDPNSLGETRELAVDAAGNAVIVGLLDSDDTFSFGSQTLTSSSRRNFAARFNATGQWQYALLNPVGTNSGQGSYLSEVALDGAGNLLAVGGLNNRNSVTFGSTVLTGSEGGDAIVGRLTSAGVVTAQRRPAGMTPLALYPNPSSAGAAVTLRLPAAATAAQPIILRDALGRTVRESTLAAGHQQISLSTAGLAPGLYQVQAGLSRAQLVVAE